MEQECIVCRYSVAYIDFTVPLTHAVRIYTIRCPRCGNYKMELLPPHPMEPSRVLPKEFTSELIPYFIGYTREQTILKNDVDIKYSDISNIAEYILRQSPKTVSEKIDKLIINISRISKYYGDLIEFNPEVNYPLGYCKNTDEVVKIIEYLTTTKRQYLKTVGSGVSLMVDGWDRIHDLSKVPLHSTQVFIAMWFDPTMDKIYKKIEDAVWEAGYKPIRVDRAHFTGDINDKIIAEIRKSKFLIADYTGQRHGVYYEAGYAKGMGLEVISSCNENDKQNLHFDTSHQNHIIWKTDDELHDKLLDRILAIIGQGPEKRP